MKKVLLILSAVAIFTSCKKDEHLNTEDKHLNTNLTVNFTHTVDGNQLTTDEMIYQNANGEDYSVITLKYLISGIELQKEDGSTIVLKDVHSIDINDPSSLSFTIDSLDNSLYTSIAFNYGLDTSRNISNYYVNEDFHATMFWPDMMGGGYHYMKLEGAYTNDSTFYNTHTGGTMGMDFSFTKEFDVNLNVCNESGDATIDINMEINNWYTNPNTISFAGAIMGDATKQMQLKANGSADVFSTSYTIE